MLSLLKNVNVYSPEHIGLKDILIANGKITEILDTTEKQTLNIPSSWNVEVINYNGAYLLPGFIDAHAHITGGGGEAGFSTQAPSIPLSDFTSVGVTTVVGLLGTDDTTRSMANLLSRVYGLREEGLSAYCWTGGYHYPLTTLTGSAKSDITFLDPVIGIGEFAISDHRSSQPTYEEVLKLASETHVAGLITGKAGIMHFHLGDGDRKLDLIERAISETELPARVFNPTHVNRNKPLFEDSCKLLSKGSYIDITALPKGSLETWMGAAEAIESVINHDLPLDKITVSSDGGGCLPCFDKNGNVLKMGFGKPITLLETLQQTMDKGFALETILPMFTSNVADLLRFHRKGRIEKGKDADLLVLNDQFEVTDVMAQGRWHKRDGELVIVGTFE